MRPCQHYLEAQRLMGKVADMAATLPITRELVAQAHVHAVLAQTPHDTVAAAHELQHLRDTVTNGTVL